MKATRFLPILATASLAAALVSCAGGGHAEASTSTRAGVNVGGLVSANTNTSVNASGGGSAQVRKYR